VEQNAARMLMLQLTDGAVELQAMEYRPVLALSTSLPPGTKVCDMLMISAVIVIVVVL